MPRGLEITSDHALWRRWLEDFHHDPRDTPAYHDAALSIEGGRPLCARFESPRGVLLYPFLKRPIPDSEVFDITTVYDLGGYLVAYQGPDEGTALLDGFEDQWREWCRAEGIVSEFIRLNPLRRPSSDPILAPRRFEHHQDHAVVDLRRLPAEPSQTYVGNHRRDVARAAQAGLVCERLTPQGHREFFELYHRTMRRVGAAAFYFFPESFFRDLVNRIPGCEIFGVRSSATLVAAAFLLRSPSALFYFLSASDPEAWHLKPNNALLDGVIRWARDEGLDHLHLGGGSRSLRRFKMGFGARAVPYYVRRNVHDQDRYRDLARERDNGERDFFPRYRASAHFGRTA